MLHKEAKIQVFYDDCMAFGVLMFSPVANQRESKCSTALEFSFGYVTPALDLTTKHSCAEEYRYNYGLVAFTYGE